MFRRLSYVKTAAVGVGDTREPQTSTKTGGREGRKAGAYCGFNGFNVPVWQRRKVRAFILVGGVGSSEDPVTQGHPGALRLATL